jgi:hypothetical protein
MIGERNASIDASRRRKRRCFPKEQIYQSPITLQQEVACLHPTDVNPKVLQHRWTSFGRTLEKVGPSWGLTTTTVNHRMGFSINSPFALVCCHIGERATFAGGLGSITRIVRKWIRLALEIIIFGTRRRKQGMFWRRDRRCLAAIYHGPYG